MSKFLLALGSILTLLMFQNCGENGMQTINSSISDSRSLASAANSSGIESVNFEGGQIIPAAEGNQAGQATMVAVDPLLAPKTIRRVLIKVDISLGLMPLEDGQKVDLGLVIEDNGAVSESFYIFKPNREKFASALQLRKLAVLSPEVLSSLKAKIAKLRLSQEKVQVGSSDDKEIRHCPLDVPITTFTADPGTKNAVVFASQGNVCFDFILKGAGQILFDQVNGLRQLSR